MQGGSEPTSHRWTPHQGEWSGGWFGRWMVKVSPGDMGFTPIRVWGRRQDSTVEGVAVTSTVPDGRGR